jgi:hypothetical protein
MTIKEATYQLLYKKMLMDLDPSGDQSVYDGEVEALQQVLVNLLKQQPVLES